MSMAIDNFNNEISKCFYGCGNIGSYYIKNKKIICCSKTPLFCPNFKNFKFNEIIDICKIKNGICLSNKYDNSNSKLEFYCNICGTKWKTYAYHILGSGSWCPKCGIKKASKKQKKDLELIKEYVKTKFNGECISNEYINAHELILFKCSNGHFFKQNWNKIQNRNQWCKKCNTIYTTEELCRFILEQLTGGEFIKTRKIIKGYELDGYCEKLNLAFEYNGEQHYIESPIFHGKNRTLNQQKKRDIYVRKKCKELNITLIIIPYWKYKNKENLFMFIKNKIIKNKIKIQEKINWEKLKIYGNELNKIKSIVESRGGTLISTTYINAKTPIEVWCGIKTHKNIFITSNAIRQGSLCPECSKFKRKKDFINYEECKKIVRSLNIKGKIEFEKWSKTTDRILLKIPSHPPIYYKKEWLGWKNFLN